jgi:hypothetical protein
MSKAYTILIFPHAIMYFSSSRRPRYGKRCRRRRLGLTENRMTNRIYEENSKCQSSFRC